MKLTKEDCEHIVALRSSPRFQKFIGMLGERASDSVDQMLTCTDSNTMWRLQGATKILVEISDAVADAPNTLKQFENKQ